MRHLCELIIARHEKVSSQLFGLSEHVDATRQGHFQDLLEVREEAGGAHHARPDPRPIAVGLLVELAPQLADEALLGGDQVDVQQFLGVQHVRVDEATHRPGVFRLVKEVPILLS